MPLRLTASNIVAPVLLVALSAAAFRVYNAPERIRLRLETAREVCEKSGARWAVDDRGTGFCQRD